MSFGLKCFVILYKYVMTNTEVMWECVKTCDFVVGLFCYFKEGIFQ